ncbi:MAG: aspartate carbamoyltransferase [Pleurocapsa minor GSE-CHR-MK-17-07R]|jgi:carbamoyl-phosphate synthase/aspartate carbamoyltransferase/dihydroorotase|nr:aspartate carbamoyltransferase [Pleurocapsa minor GSE-CHR-MK 17-07R]
MTDSAASQHRQSQPFLSLHKPTPIDGSFAGKHIVTVDQFSKADLRALFDVVFRFREGVRAGDRSLIELCATHVMASLFYEASTRTDMSFQAAMRRLGGRVIAASNGVQFSSVYKGEDLADSIRAAACYADVIVLRHPEVGSSYQAAWYLDQLGEQLGHRTLVISGGDGVGEHPTQALLDMFTIVDLKGGTSGKMITMVGDLKHGRTVHSLAKLIGRLEPKDCTLALVSPDMLQMPDYIVEYLRQRNIALVQTDTLADVLPDSDVVYWTRVQEERFDNRADYEAIRDAFVMTPDVLASAKPDMILMHPLPRKNEMGDAAQRDALDRDPRAAYFKQMENGMFVRMAILAAVLGTVKP